MSFENSLRRSKSETLVRMATTSSLSNEISLRVKTIDENQFSIKLLSTALVATLKEKIATETGVIATRQRLIFRGKVLINEELISTYSIGDGHTLHLLVKPESTTGSSNNNTTSNSNTRSSTSSAPPSTSSTTSTPTFIPPGSIMMGATFAIQGNEAVDDSIMRSVMASVMNSMNNATTANTSTTGSSGGNSSSGTTGNSGFSFSSFPMMRVLTTPTTTTSSAPTITTTGTNRRSRPRSGSGSNTSGRDGSSSSGVLLARSRRHNRQMNLLLDTHVRNHEVPPTTTQEGSSSGGAANTSLSPMAIELLQQHIGQLTAGMAEASPLLNWLPRNLQGQNSMERISGAISLLTNFGAVCLGLARIANSGRLPSNSSRTSSSDAFLDTLFQRLDNNSSVRVSSVPPARSSAANNSNSTRPSAVRSRSSRRNPTESSDTAFDKFKKLLDDKLSASSLILAISDGNFKELFRAVAQVATASCQEGGFKDWMHSVLKTAVAKMRTNGLPQSMKVLLVSGHDDIFTPIETRGIQHHKQLLSLMQKCTRQQEFTDFESEFQLLCRNFFDDLVADWKTSLQDSDDLELLAKMLLSRNGMSESMSAYITNRFKESEFGTSYFKTASTSSASSSNKKRKL